MLQEKSNPKGARELYERAAVDPHHLGTVNNFRKFFAKDEPRWARELFERAVTIDLHDVSSLNNLASVVEQTDPRRARDLYENGDRPKSRTAPEQCGGARSWK